MKKFLLIVSAVLMLLGITAYAEDRVPTFSNTSNAANLGVWGGWDGVTMTKVNGDSGSLTDVLIQGGVSAGGCTFSLNDGDCAAGAHKSNTAYNGFVDASDFVIRYKSTAGMIGHIILEYRTVNPYRYFTSKVFSLPNTNGEWSDLKIPFSSIEPDTDGKWIYNINGAYSSNYNPVVTLKLENVNFRDTKSATISSITANWYQEDMLTDASVSGFKPSYFQNYDSFDYSQGTVTITRAGVTQTLSLTDPWVTISGYGNKTIKNDPTDSKNLKMKLQVLNKIIYFYVRIVPYMPTDITGIKVNSPKNTYIIKDFYDFTKGTVTASFNDKPDETVNLDNPNVKVTGFDSSAIVSNQIITVTYGGMTATYTINIGDFVISEPISVQNPKRIYKVGEKFDWHTGIIIPAQGATGKLYSRYATMTGFDSSVPAKDQVITITYGGVANKYSTTYKIDIIDDETLPLKYTIESDMSYGNQPSLWSWGSCSNKMIDGKAEDGISPAIYITGDCTGGSGGAIVLTNGNFGGGTNIMEDGNALRGFIGADVVKIRYNLVSAAQTKIYFYNDYTVGDVSSASVVLPSTSGEWKDIIIPINSFDSTSATGTDETTIGKYDWTYNMMSQYSPGTGTYEPAAQIRFSGKYLTGEYFSIENIKFMWNEENPIESITVSNAKTVYGKDEKFDSKGKLNIIYRDGTTGQSNLSNANITGFDSSAAALDQALTVTYGGAKTTYNVNVLGNINVTYTGTKFENSNGEAITNFGGQSVVVAKITAENTDTIVKQPYGVLMAVVYKDNKILKIKKFENKEIPQGTTDLTAQFSTSELTNATKIKIIALEDAINQRPIFSTVGEIGK